MMTGIEINEKHSYRDFGALLARRSFEYPEELQVTESVPYSDIEYDFTELYGKQVLNRRDVIYRFKFVHPNSIINEDNIRRFIKFIYGLHGDIDIFEDDNTLFHWVGRRTTVKNIDDTVGYELGARMIEVTFRCIAKQSSNLGDAFVSDDTRWPDINNDGSVTASDAQDIMIAASNLGAGYPSGLTEEQELRADCDRDGIITASDAQLCLTFISECGSGNYKETPQGWADFLNDQFGLEPEVI